ncbi:type VI secretion system-associated protein VasI [Escherichia coli]
MSRLCVFRQTGWFIAGLMAGLPASAAPAETSSVAGVAVAVATATPPDATATLQAMQSCRQETAELLVTQVPGERPTVVITTPAIGHVPPRPVLMFSCVDNITRMQVALMHPLDVHDIAVTLNADSRALRSHWFVRENGTLLESSRGLSGIDEIKQLFGAKTLTVDTGTDNAAGKLTFNIDGLARVIAPLRDACHWAGE